MHSAVCITFWILLHTIQGLTVPIWYIQVGLVFLGEILNETG